MSEEYWDGNDEVAEDDGFEVISDYDTSIKVNGSELEVEPGSNFGQTVKGVAMDAGLGKFRVYLNGMEVKPSEAPATVSEGDNVELRQYDVAG